MKRELERGGATKATIEREREKETERRTQELKRGQARNTRTTFFGMTASSAGALEENGEDHLYVLLLKRLALEAPFADGGAEIGVLLVGPARKIRILPLWQLSHLFFHSCTEAKGRESERSAITKERERECV